MNIKNDWKNDYSTWQTGRPIIVVPHPIRVSIRPRIRIRHTGVNHAAKNIHDGRRGRAYSTRQAAAHGENRKRKGFLIGGVRLQWRRSGVGGPAVMQVPLPQGFKASWLWKHKLEKTSWKRRILHAASGSLSNSCSHLFNQANEWALENFAIILWLISIILFNLREGGGKGCFSRRETRRPKKDLQSGGGALRQFRGHFFLITSVVASLQLV